MRIEEMEWKMILFGALRSLCEMFLSCLYLSINEIQYGVLKESRVDSWVCVPSLQNGNKNIWICSFPHNMILYSVTKINSLFAKQYIGVSKKILKSLHCLALEKKFLFLNILNEI